MFTCCVMSLGSAFWCGISFRPNFAPLAQPSLFGASLTSKMERGMSCCTRSSLIILCSRKFAKHTAVYDSIPRIDARIFALDLDGGFGCFGVEHEVVVTVRAVLVATPQSACAPPPLTSSTYASSISRASFRKAFLHFLHMKVKSKVCMSV